MARNVIESEFRTSKMGAGSHFVKKIHKIKIVVLIWNCKKCDTRCDFWTSKMATGGHFLKNIYKESCASDLNNVQTDCWPTTTWYKFTFGQYIYTYRQLCWERGNTRCVRPLGRMHTILVVIIITVPWVNILMAQQSSAAWCGSVAN